MYCYTLRIVCFCFLAPAAVSSCHSDCVTHLHPDGRPVVVTCTVPCRYIVLMSDGIFEFMDSQQILGEVHTAAQAGQPPSEVAKKLVKMARK